MVFASAGAIRFSNPGILSRLLYSRAFKPSRFWKPGRFSFCNLQSPILKILISPNPANDQINLTGLNTTNPGYQVYDMTGKCVMRGTIFSEPSVRTSSLETGAYLIVLKNADHTVSRCKFIISR